MKKNDNKKADKQRIQVLKPYGQFSQHFNPWQRKFNQKHGNDMSNNRHKYRFSKKLPYQIFRGSTKSFSDTHFARPVNIFSGGKIHEIETCS